MEKCCDGMRDMSLIKGTESRLGSKSGRKRTSIKFGKELRKRRWEQNIRWGR